MVFQNKLINILNNYSFYIKNMPFNTKYFRSPLRTLVMQAKLGQTVAVTWDIIEVNKDIFVYKYI